MKESNQPKPYNPISGESIQSRKDSDPHLLGGASATNAARHSVLDSIHITIALVVLSMASFAIAGTIKGPTAAKLAPLFFVFIVLLSYLVNRLHAAQYRLVDWQILVAGLFLGFNSAMTLMLVMFYFFSR